MFYTIRVTTGLTGHSEAYVHNIKFIANNADVEKALFAAEYN